MAAGSRDPHRGWLLGGVAATVLVLLGFTIFGDTSTELYPDRLNLVFELSIIPAVAGAGTIFILSYRSSPASRLRSLFTALALAGSTGVFILATSLVPVDRVVQAFDFGGKSPSQHVGFFPIRRAYLSHGKGSHYHVQLATYFADFDVAKADYATIAGNAENVHPTGWCLRTEWQRSPRALRVFHPSVRSYRTGIVMPCPAGAPSL